MKEIKSNIKGSEKQIDWANKIKKEMMENLESIKHPSYAKVQENISENLDIMNNMVDSKFWIENRDCQPKDILRYIELED